MIEAAQAHLIWFQEKDTPDDELISEVCFHGNADGTLTLSVAHFTKIMQAMGYERVLGR